MSENFEHLSFIGKVKDYLWHMCLPIISMVLGSFAALTYLTKYSFVEELNKPYVLTARSKGLNENQVLFRHVFRNAILIVVAALPETLVGIFFVGNLFIEIIFNLDGVGLLGLFCLKRYSRFLIKGDINAHLVIQNQCVGLSSDKVRPL